MQQAFHFSIVAQLIVEKKCVQHYINVLFHFNKQENDAIVFFTKKLKSKKNLAPVGTDLFFK